MQRQVKSNRCRSLTSENSVLLEIFPIIYNWLFLFVFVGKSSKDKFFTWPVAVSLLQFPSRLCMEINRVTPGNQPLVRADYPRFSSDCLMIALPLTKPTHRRAKLSLNIIRPNYPASKLSPICRQNYHSSPPPSSTLPPHFATLSRRINRFATTKNPKQVERLNCGNRRGSGVRRNREQWPPIDTTQCLL